MRRLPWMGSILVVTVLAACGSDSTEQSPATGGTAGSTGGTAGSTGGTAGSTGGTAGGTGGTAGSTGGTAGSTGGTGGTAGSTGGTAGSTGGTAGSTGGTAGSSGGGNNPPPTFFGDFDSGTLGAAPTGPDGYHNGAAQGPNPAVYDDTRAFSGSQSAKMNTAVGEKFFGIAGMEVPGGELAEGDEIWRQEKFWIPSDFDFTGGQPAVKWINFAPNNGTGRVYWNLQASGWALISETDGGTPYLHIDEPIPRDQWVTVETWMKVTSVSEPCMRLWVNGEFLGEKTTTTIGDASNKIDEIRLGDYWNLGAPSVQSFWVDDLVIYNSSAGDIPGNLDAGGRRYIGIE